MSIWLISIHSRKHTNNIGYHLLAFFSSTIQFWLHTDNKIAFSLFPLGFFCFDWFRFYFTKMEIYEHDLFASVVLHQSRQKVLTAAAVCFCCRCNVGHLLLFFALCSLVCQFVGPWIRFVRVHFTISYFQINERNAVAYLWKIE